VVLSEVIDTSFDFRSDTPRGGDPDSDSPTLRRYHRRLWSKPLPSGFQFELDNTTPYVYLRHSSAQLGEFFLSSDTVIPSFWRSVSMKYILDGIPKTETDEFNRVGYTIGAMMIWPGNRIDGAMTINQARGCRADIRDRFDLTVERIRRYYRCEPSPLGSTLARYPEFFRLFGDFAGFVDFFLLQDLVDEDSQTVKFMAPFGGGGDWPESPYPRPRHAYLDYRERATEFIKARNERIALTQTPGRR
jgi:hypothetical protein